LNPKDNTDFDTFVQQKPTGIVLPKFKLPLESKKPSGKLTVIWSPDESTVAVVKANVTLLLVASGTRSAAAIVIDTPVTCPPSDPDGAPSLDMSLIVLTVMPVAMPAVAGPNVTPLSVITCTAAETLFPTRSGFRELSMDILSVQYNSEIVPVT